MFELNGTQYTLEQVEEAAKASNITVEEYITKAGLTEVGKQKPTSQTTAAAVGVNTLDTELQSADGSLESQDPAKGFFEQVFGADNDREETYEQRELRQTIELENKIAETAAKREIDPETGKFKELSSTDKMLNSVGNMADQFQQFVPNLVISSNKIFRGIFGDEAIDSFVANESIPEFFKEGLSDEDLDEAIQQVKLQEAEMQSTGEITKGFAEGDVGEIAAGIVNGITSIGSSLAINTLTAGGGLIPDMIGRSYVDYNSALAEGKGKTLSDLIKDGEDEVTVPAAIGTLSGLLERAGLKGAGKAILNKAVTKGINKTLASMLISGNKEGLTELAQTGLEASNIASAKGENKAEAFVDAVTSREGLEAYLQGFVGGGIITGSRSNVLADRNDILKASSVMRSDSDASFLSVTQQEIKDLQEKRQKTRNKEVKKVIDEKIEQKTQSMRDMLIEENKVINNMSESELYAASKSFDKIKKLSKKSQQIKQQAANSFISSDEQNILLEELNSNLNKERQKLSEIKSNSITRADEALEKNVKTAEEQSSKLDNVSFKSFDTIKDFEDYILSKDKGKTKASVKVLAQTNDGVILQNNGTQEIIINKEIAKKSGAINVGAHELLHGILYKTLKENPNAAVALGNSLTKQINKLDLSDPRALDFKQRLDLYKDEDAATRGEETLTLFSDATAQGLIKYDENLFTKTGDILRRIFDSVGYKRTFKSGRDVYNFIKDYNKDIAKGGIRQAFVQAAKEGINVKIKPTSKIQKAADNVLKGSRSNLNSLLEKYGNDPKTLIAQGLSKTPQGQETFEFTKSEFGQEVAPIVESLTKKLYDPIPEDAKRDVSRSDYKDAMISELATIISTEYDPAKQDIDTFTTIRAFQRSNRLAKNLGIESVQEFGGTGIKTDVTEAKGIAADEVEITANTKKLVDAIGVSKSILDKGDQTMQRAIIKAENAIVGKEMTPSQKVRARDKALSEVFNQQLEKDLKKEFLKTAKNNETFNSFLDKNWKEVAAVYLKNTNVNKIPEGRGKEILQGWNEQFPSKQEVVDYFQGKDLDNKQAISNRKNRSLANAIVKEIISDRKQKFIKEDSGAVAEFEAKTGIKFSKSLKDLNIKSPEAFTELKGVLDKQFTNKALANAKNNMALALQNIGVEEIFKNAFGDTPGVTKFNNLVKDFDKLYADLKTAAEPTFEYEGKRYELAAFLKDKILGDLENKSYKLVVKALTGFDVDVDLSNPTFVNSARRSLAKIIKPLGRNFFERYLERGMKAPSKIGKGDLVIENGKLVFNPSNKKDATNRFGFFQNADDVTNWKNEVFGKGKENKNLGNFSSLTSQVVKTVKFYGKKSNVSGDQTMFSKKQLLGIRKDTLENNKAFVKLINALKKANKNGQIGINETVAILMAMNNNPLGLTRTSAILEHIPTKRFQNEKYTLEHMIPALSVNLAALDHILSKEDKTNFSDMMSNYRITYLPKSYDDIVNKFYKAHMPFYWNFDKTAFLRYFNPEMANEFDVEFESIVNGTIVNAATFNVEKQQSKIKSSKSIKKIRIFDFDDTLAQSNSQVLYTLPNGTTGKLNATEYAKRDQELKDKGATFNFSEFSKVIDGKKGPLFKVAQKINAARGNEDLFVLTARPANAAGPIQEFLKLAGLDFKKENIIGLGDGTAQAKADWVQSKVNEGYNDFYFADDAIKNVEAVKQVLDSSDVKGKVQQAKVKSSKSLDADFNAMLERVKGVKADARYSEDRATKLGAKKGKFKFFIPYSAEDFVGLIYPTLGKGAEGDKNMQWYKDNILNPYATGYRNFEAAKQLAMQQWADLKKQIKKTPANLKKESVRGFSNEEAVRVYLWDKQNTVPDTLAKKDVSELVKYVENTPELLDFATQVNNIVGPGKYPNPQGDWLAGTITTDLVNYTNTVSRKEYLQEWQDNVDVVYSKDNLNKLKALYGNAYVEALQDMLYRMKTGRNRPSGSNKLTNQFMNWINDSVGTIMFFNTRSALLQTISSVNYLNWSDNNPVKAAAAFANQKQFWNDFAEIFNSDFLKQRRSGLKTDVNADEIARMASTADNKVRAALSAILKKGFLPTQLADSFAISIGGTSFYRNRINTYLKEGLSEKEAKEKAFLDFKEITEESQQSSRPDRVSMQQASPLGRVILAFANTPMQYGRLMKKATLDLVNGRGDWKTNTSKILYYGAVQNLIFTFLQQAMFAMLFSDDDDDEEQDRYFRMGNSIADSLLRGVGVGGAVVATAKNLAMKTIEEYKSGRPDYTDVALELTTLSPPINSKLRKLQSAGRSFTYKQTREEMREKGIAIDNPAAEAGGQIISALTNVPADRAIRKMNNLKTATDQDLEMWQSIALALGYSKWDVGIKNSSSKIKTAEEILREAFRKKSKLPFKKKKRKTKKKEDQGTFGNPFKKLEDGVLGKAHKDGTIEIKEGLSPAKKKEVIAHEKKHLADMKSGKLDYDDQNVYWDGKPYPRLQGKKIVYNGVAYLEGHKKLPWEKSANNIKI